MKLCPTCQRCYEDKDISCTEKDHGALIFKRTGTRIIDRRYRLDVLLGGGGMGAVYKCTHIQLNRQRAIKLLLPDSANADPHGRQRLKQEAVVACTFDHPNVVRIHDFGTNTVSDKSDGVVHRSDELYIVMELLEGETLREYLRRIKPVPLDQAITIALHIADGLAAVHSQHVIHRDLKPANIMLTRDHRGELLVKIVDFGAVKLIRDKAEPTNVDLTGSLMVGSAAYTSPENCRGLPLDQRSDIYCLGLILFEMLAGRRPFESQDRVDLIHQHAYATPPSLLAIAKQVPAPLAQLVMSALEKEPDARPQSATEFMQALRTIQHSTVANVESDSNEETRLSGTAPRVVPEERGKQKESAPVRSGPTIFAAALLFLFLLMSAFFIKTLIDDVKVKTEDTYAPVDTGVEANANDVTQPTSNCLEGHECVTTTDANLRDSPGRHNKWVGLAETGSRVRVLKVKSNWRQVMVLEHGRQKEHPESADEGWLDGSTLRPLN
jgi:serine/threonine protein kinase